MYPTAQLTANIPLNLNRSCFAMTRLSESHNHKRSVSSIFMLFPRREIKSPILLGMTIATLMALIILGGAPNVPGWQSSVMMVFSAALIASAFYFGSFAEFSKLGLLQKTFLFSLILVPLIQVIPLPPSIWQSFPGRSLENEMARSFPASSSLHVWRSRVLLTLFPQHPERTKFTQNK